MPGRPEFSQPGTEGGGQTVATQDRPEPVDFSVDTSETIAAGENETVEINPPEGAVYRLIALYTRADPVDAATDGRQEMRVRPLATFMATRARATYDQPLSFESGHWIKADVQEDPPEKSAQQLAIQELIATKDSPIQIEYINNTDADQTANRSYRAVLEKRTF